MNQWISVAANIGTAVAASLAFLALHEMKRQRAQADKPKLLLSAVDTTFHIYWTEIKDPWQTVLPLKYTPGEGESVPHTIGPEEDATDLTNALDRLVQSVKFELINAGLGPAVEVNITWAIEPPIRQLTKELNESNLGIFLEAKYSKGSCRELAMGAKKRRRDLIFYLVPGGARTEFPYLLPYLNMEKNKRIITIPHVLMLILQLMLAAEAIRVDRPLKRCLPHLFCNISFKDRAGRKYKDRFIVEFKIWLMIDQGLIRHESNTECAGLHARVSLK